MESMTLQQHLETTTTISTKKYQKLILSDRYRFITRQDEGG